MRYLLLLSFLVLVGCSSEEAKRNEFFIKGNNALDRGAFKEAVAHFTNALKVDSTFAEALNNRGVAQIESGNAYDAIADYNQALLLKPDYDECRLNRSYAFEFVGQYDNALRDIAQLTKQSPDSAYLHFYQGLVLTKMRKYREALDAFDVSVDLGMDQTETYVNMGTIYYFLGRNDSARYYLERVFASQPKEPNALNTLSQVFLSEGNFSQALFAIEQALEVVPNEPYFLNNRGLVYLEMGELEKGLSDINQSIVLNPANGWAYRNKGLYYLKKGAYDRAIALFERALSSNEFIDEIHYYYGTALRAKGRTTEACQQWILGRDKGERRSISSAFGC